MKTSEQNKKIYEEQFNKEELYHKVHESKINKMLALINETPKKILDIGCGDGWVGSILKKKYNAEVHGVDILDKALIKAGKKGIITKKFDLSNNKWPYKNNTFDLIIAGDIIEHLYDTENFAKECHRILKPKGLLIISTPNINSLNNRFLVLSGRMPLYIDFAPNISSYKSVPPSGHVHVFNKATIKQLLTTYGFKIEKITGAHFNAVNELMPEKIKRFSKIINKIQTLITTNSSIAEILIVKARK